MEPQSGLPPSIVSEGANLISGGGLSIAGLTHCTYCDCLKGWLEVGKKDLEAELVLLWSVEMLIQDISDEAKLFLHDSLNFCLLICCMSHRHHQLLSVAYQGSGNATHSFMCSLKHSLSSSCTWLPYFSYPFLWGMCLLLHSVFPMVPVSRHLSLTFSASLSFNTVSLGMIEPSLLDIALCGNLELQH